MFHVLPLVHNNRITSMTQLIGFKKFTLKNFQKLLIAISKS